MTRGAWLADHDEIRAAFQREVVERAEKMGHSGPHEPALLKTRFDAFVRTLIQQGRVDPVVARGVKL